MTTASLRNDSPRSNGGGSRRTVSMFALVLTLSLMIVVNVVWNMPAKSNKEIVDSWQELARRQTLEQIPLVSENQGSNDGKQVKNPSSIHRLERLDTIASNDILPSDKKESFSACLLTMDDAHFLIEWIAYHYHTLPLRHLIVAVDPHSQTSPSFVFDKWRNYTDLQIEEWTDLDFMDQVNQADTNGHRNRQKAFNQACLKTLKQANKTWTLMIDVDEYLSFNTYTRTDVETDLTSPGAFLSFLQHEQQQQDENNETVLHTQGPCIMMPRVRYGSVESTIEEIHDNVSHSINASAFTTLRFRKYGNPMQKRMHGAGKTLLDVSRISAKYMKKSSPHRPTTKCTREVFIKPNKSPLVVRHYLGTLEQYSFRKDARQADNIKTKEGYDRAKDLHHGSDDALRSWINGFITSVGVETAMELLEGVGNVSVAPLVFKE